MTTVQSAIQALLKATAMDRGRHKEIPPQPVIAISRDYGALGDEIAAAVAQKLDIPLYDREILDKVAERIDADPDDLKMLDESVARARDMWLVRLFTGKDLSEDTYRNHLVNVILGLSHVGGVILGRGSNVILSTSCALRVRITGSLEVCAKRVAAAENLSLEEAERRISEVNQARGRFVWEMFHRRTADASNFDLVINTDRLNQIDHVVTMLTSAYRAIEADSAHIPA